MTTIDDEMAMMEGDRSMQYLYNAFCLHIYHS